MRRVTPRLVLSQLLLQLRVVGAVARREMQLRAQKGIFGLLGVFIEPLVLIATFLALRIFLGGSGDQYMNAVLWMALGFVPFFMFSDIAIKAISGVEKNSELYFYRRLKPLDSLLGNTLLLSQIFGLLVLAFVFGVSLWEWQFAVQDVGHAVFLFIGISMLGFGVGLVTLIIGHRLPFVAWIIKMFLRRILLWTSCVFFSISFVPDVARPWILWNPIAHGIELMRIAASPSYPAPGVSAPYFWAWVVGSVGLGLFIYGNNEELLFAVDKVQSDSDDADDV